MSKDWVSDIEAMHDYYRFKQRIQEKISSMSDEDRNAYLKSLLDFRYSFLKEEMRELGDAVDAYDNEQIVDALIDLCVVAIGTLDLFNIDSHKAWTEILKANMNKEPGIKPNRPNPLGLPDLMKPAGWVGPEHLGNHGILPQKK